MPAPTFFLLLSRNDYKQECVSSFWFPFRFAACDAFVIFLKRVFLFTPSSHCDVDHPFVAALGTCNLSKDMSCLNVMSLCNLSFLCRMSSLGVTFERKCISSLCVFAVYLESLSCLSWTDWSFSSSNKNLDTASFCNYYIKLRNVTTQ